MKYQDIENSKFEVRLLCRDCGKKLNSTIPMSAEEMYADWTRLVFTAGFNAGKCPNGCRSTFSDLNINTSMPIYDVKTDKPIVFQLFKFLRGNFYSDDYDKVCSCKDVSEEEIYESEKYPAVHGRCGQWLTSYKDKSLSDTKRYDALQAH